MNVLVTGATGRVGSRLVPRLLGLPEVRSGQRNVRLLVRDPDRAKRFTDLGAELVVGDLRAPDARARAVEGVDTILHLGVVLTELLAGASEADAMAVNRDATVELARTGKAAGVGRFVFVSTNRVYGPGYGRPARESDELRPDGGIYPTSKAEAEQALLALDREVGLGLRIARLAFVYGDADPHLESFLGIGEGALGWAARLPAHQRLHMVHHADVAQALVRLLRVDGLDGRTYNVADDAPMTVAELFALHGKEIPDGASERTVDDPWADIVDVASARTDLGFRPIHPTMYAAHAAGAL